MCFFSTSTSTSPRLPYAPVLHLEDQVPDGDAAASCAHLAVTVATGAAEPDLPESRSV